MSVSASEATLPDPHRYFDHIADERGAIAEVEPVCLYIETTNRCNLLCTTCPRTFEALEPPADMSLGAVHRVSSTSFRGSRASSCTASASR